MESKTKPIFILGLPRSGTSLLLTILSTHKEIAGMAETWFLLPFLYANKSHGVVANYSHNLGYSGLKDLIHNLPGKESQYNSYLKDFFDKVYGALALNHKYFIDKVPRYYYVIPELAKLFPDAKFIFIFRNPVQIYASRMISGIGNNRFSIFRQRGNYFDIIEGPKYLTEGYKLLRDKAYAMNFEQFVIEPEKYIQEILNYLDLEFDKDILTTFDPAKLSGNLLDPNIFMYGKTIQKSVTEKWKEVFNQIIPRGFASGFRIFSPEFQGRCQSRD